MTFSFCLQYGWISVNQPSSKRAVNNLKSCMSFQFPPYWDGFHLFQWGRPERFPLKCEESQRTFLAQPAIKPRTELTVVDGGTSTAGRWDGEQSNEDNKEKECTHTKKNITYLIC